jgi:hypothetical protein
MKNINFEFWKTGTFCTFSKFIQDKNRDNPGKIEKSGHPKIDASLLLIVGLNSTMVWASEDLTCSTDLKIDM